MTVIHGGTDGRASHRPTLFGSVGPPYLGGATSTTGTAARRAAPRAGTARPDRAGRRRPRAVRERGGEQLRRARPQPTDLENIDLLGRTPRGRPPDHRPRRVAHCVRPTQPTG